MLAWSHRHEAASARDGHPASVHVACTRACRNEYANDDLVRNGGLALLSGLTPSGTLEVDPDLYARACAIEGYFTEQEASLLCRAIQTAGRPPVYLEVGSFRGRSTMFALSALPPEGRVIAVDAFVYSDHSAAELRATLQDGRVSVLEGTLAQNWSRIARRRPNVVLIDADHSFAGVVVDLSLSVALAQADALIATHDFSDRFPGVKAAVGALVDAGVLRHVESSGDLAVWAVQERPAWLIDPRPELTSELPEDAAGWVPELVQLTS